MNSTEEIWKEVEGYEGYYEVSNLGNVRSYSNRAGGVTKYPKILKIDKANTGYGCVALTRNRKVKRTPVHRLVAKAFIPNPNNYPCVNHKDENRLNNHVDNLEWCTHLYNVRYSKVWEKGNKTKTLIKCKNAPKAVIGKYNDEVVIRFSSLTEARKNGYQSRHIMECINGKKETYNNLVWELEDNCIYE